MKRILIFSHEFPPCLGGAGTVADILRNCFTSQSIFNVKILTSSRTKSDNNRGIISIPFSKKLWFIAYIPWLLLNRNKFDIIICNDPAAIYCAGLIAGKNMFHKMICIVHGMEKHLDGDDNKAKLINFSYYFKKSLINSKKVCFVSSFIRHQYSDVYDINIGEERGCVIHTGVSSKYKNHARQHIKSPASRKYFLTVSRFVRGKGFDKMLQVFLELKKLGVNYKWYIVGDGPYKSEFEKELERYHLKDAVSILGRFEREELPKIYSEVDYYILLSELEESFGLSYLEAAAAGATVIGYDSYGVKEAFQYIEKGLSLNPNLNSCEIAKEIQKITMGEFGGRNKCFRYENDFFEDIKKVIFER